MVHIYPLHILIASVAGLMNQQQAGLASRKLTFRDVFVPQLVPAPLVLVGPPAGAYHGSVETRKRVA